MVQLKHNASQPQHENWRDKYDSELENHIWTIQSENGKPYEESTYLRVMGVGQFVQALAAEGKKIVGMTFKDNLLGFILDKDE